MKYKKGDVVLVVPDAYDRRAGLPDYFMGTIHGVYKHTTSYTVEWYGLRTMGRATFNEEQMSEPTYLQKLVYG